MSLQVWFPLNGDLTQQGLSKISAINNGATINDNGKIGKCYSFGTAASDLTLPASSMTGFTTEASISFWIKILSWNTSYATFFQAGPASTAWTAYRFGILRNNTNSNLCFTISSSSSASNANYTTSNLELNTWYHLSFCYKTGHCLIYINGTLYKDYTTTIVPDFAGITTVKIGRCTNGSSYQTNCLLNDFRIYDHCLSAKEVKQIAKGLVLHYTLNNYSFYGKNLLYGTSKKVYSATVNTANDRDKGILSGGSGGNGSFSITEEDVPVGIYSYNITNNTSGNRDFQQGRIPFISGQKYTGSWWAKGSGSCYFRSWNRTKGSAVFAKTYTLTNNWQFFSYTFTATAAQGTDDCTWHLGVTGKSSIKIAGMKLELGDKPTIYSPAPEDLQLTGQEIYDTSGYENHASTIGTLTLVPNSSIYNFGINMNNTGTNNHIESIKNINLSSDTITISCWIKAASKATNQVFFTMSNIQFGTLNSLGYVNPTSMAGFTLNNFINNEWNHIVVIKNGTTYQLYINGIAETQNGASNYYLHNTSKLWLLNRSYNNTYAANASISDLRIYTTAFSADDIKELYRISKVVNGTTAIARDLE